MKPPHVGVSAQANFPMVEAETVQLAIAVLPAPNVMYWHVVLTKLPFKSSRLPFKTMLEAAAWLAVDAMSAAATTTCIANLGNLMASSSEDVVATEILIWV